MLKRTVVIQQRMYVSTRDEQLVLENRQTGEIASIPIEDIGYLELESTQCTISTAALSRLARECVAVTVCNEQFIPTALCLPLEGNTLHAERLRVQMHCSLPSQKRIWQAVVRQKIQNQGAVLRAFGHSSTTLDRYAEQVYTADRTNREAAAAKVYWQTMLKPYGVGRDPEGEYPNNILNYGYAVLRSTVARSLVRAGLHPSLGIHHSNRYNAYALADDMMEPYRPFVDAHVLRYCAAQPELFMLKPEHKRHILGLLVLDVYHRGIRRPLSNSAEVLCAQLVQALAGDVGALDLPQFHA